MDPRTEFGTVPSKHHFPQLDGLRGLAVTLVVLFHYAGGATSRQPVLRLIGEANKLGWSGVTLFFVLSGFLITGILQDTRGHKHWWRNFYLRRVLRIFPLYYLSLLVAAIIGIWIYPTPLATHSVLVLAGYMQNVPGIALNTTIGTLVFYHYWSLAVEEQFYLVWPFVLQWMPNRRVASWLCLAVFIASLCFRCLCVWMHWQNMGEFSPSQAGALAAGGWLALEMRGGEVAWQRFTRLSPTIFFVSLLGVLAIGWRSGTFEFDPPLMFTLGLLLLTLMFVSLLCLCITNVWVSKIFSIGWLRQLGVISYGVYVYHILLSLLFVQISVHLAPHGSPQVLAFLRLVVCIPITLLVAALSYRYFEQPFLRLKRHFVS